MDSGTTYIKIDINGNIKKNQNKSSCLSGGANSGGNHSDMDILAIDLKTLSGKSKTRRGGVSNKKVQTLDTNCYNGILRNHKLRRLTPIECSRLQTIPDWYKWIVSDTQIYKMLGNGWTIDVIKHIFSFL